MKNASRRKRQREFGGGERGSWMQSRTLDLHKLKLGWSSVHFRHVEHADDMSDLFNYGTQESICQSGVCTFVYTALILRCIGVTVVGRLRLWMMICFPTAHVAWSDRQLTVQFMNGFPWSCIFSAIKVHTCSLPAHLNFKMSVKEIFKCEMNKGTVILPLLSGWQGRCLFLGKVHLNLYDSNCILLHLIHPKNVQTSDRESTVLNPGDEHYSPAKVDVAGCAFPLSIPQLLIQLSNH